MKEIVARLKAAGVRVVLLTPGMVDETVAPHLGAAEYNKKGLRILADEVLKLAAAEQLPVFDIHRLMNEVDQAGKAADPKFCMVPDSVHPDPAGHLVMAFGLLQALGVPPRKEELVVTGARAAGSEGLRAKRVRWNPYGVELTVQLASLPFFVEPAARKVLPFLPFQETFNEARLVVKGLSADRAYMRSGIFRGATVSREAFTAGVNLFDLWASNSMNAAAAVFNYTREKDQVYFRLWRVLGLNGMNSEWYNSKPHELAIKSGPALDRAREKLMAKAARTLSFSVISTDLPGEPVTDGDFIGRWSFLGPFPKPCTDDHVGGEALFTASVPAASAGWMAHDLDMANLGNNLGAVFGAQNDCFIYALALLDSTVDQEAELLLGSDDGFALWLNGQQLGSSLALARGVTVDSDRFPVWLHKGRNVLLLKITQGNGSWGFCARFHGLQSPLSALRPGEQ
jgi:hypothetical protein